MDIHFCEEYPDAESLAPARLIPFAATVFLATKNRSGFEAASAELGRVSSIVAPAWWPVPAETRAISVFCDPHELETITRELEGMLPQPVLLDLELPLWDPRRMLRSPRGLAPARDAVDRLFAAALRHHTVWTAEYPPAAPGRVLRWLRIVLPQAQLRTYMAYSSMLPAWWRHLLLTRLRPRLASAPSALGVGALAVGIAGNEPLLSPSGLAADLTEAEKLGAKAVLIYRLGGLTPEHAEVIAAFNDTRAEAADDPRGRQS